MVKMNLYLFWMIFLFFMGFISMFLGVYFMQYDYLFLLDWEILMVNSSCMVMTLLFDPMSLIFVGCVLFISSMVIYYSLSYMSLDVNNIRFLFLVLMFVFSMFIMIMSPNMVSILLGWDGLGLVSYCLVIYFQNFKSYGAGMLTILTNRLGDVAILLSISWMLNFGSWHFMYYIFIWDSWMFYLLLLIVLAGFTKSAQIPFSSWLPAAMAAPTPVSALVHSSTLVTAGVYLLIRFSDFFLNMNCMIFLLFSVLTMIMSGIGASFEFDLSKIIALSTLSQLGFMMSAIFFGLPLFAFFHLLTHAFFKALLFLCAGLMIHCMSDSQDIRHMGGIINSLPFTCMCFCISNLSLCGLPFLSGFYSKDLILEIYSFSGFNLFIYILYCFSVGLTVSYTFRMLYYCVFSGMKIYSCQSFFEDFNMMFSMIFLVFMSIIFGSSLMWLMFPMPPIIYLSFFMKIVPLIFIMLGALIGYELSVFYSSLNLYSMDFHYVSFFLGNMWFMPKCSTVMVYRPSLFLSKDLLDMMDMGWGEQLVSNSSLYLAYLLGKFNSFCQINNLKIFLISFFLMLLIFLI
uniref:NADH-ubiquinone oxidoreductase chain 5 n=1 Tax=Nerthra indica TaxID=1249914 RepID=C5HIL8_9HEMI|nr:NADH dehydrogenase subunit 5 [Nerthra indica]ACJ69463.1 NADH dehydrogenase subunit 5 [Nerthra indica]